MDPSLADSQAPESAGRRLLVRLQQPRVLLFLLAIWAAIGAATEFFTSSGLFVDLHGRQLDGALGGRALGWEAVPLAALYLYAIRDPERFRGVFWIALIEQSAAIIANIYHWGSGDFSFESIILPLAVAAGLDVLVLLHLFEKKEEAAAAPVAGDEEVTEAETPDPPTADTP
jgi:hypothetical protein